MPKLIWSSPRFAFKAAVVANAGGFIFTQLHFKVREQAKN